MGVSGYNYNGVLARNRRNYGLIEDSKILRIDNKIYSDTQLCRLVYKNSGALVSNNYAVEDVVRNIMCGKMCISNPSVLRNWNYSVLNSKVSSSKKQYAISRVANIVKSNWSSLNANVVLPENYPILYHGSRDGILGNIDSKHARDKCDFGNGFYMGDYRIQAELLIKNSGSAKLLYTIGVDTVGLKVYQFGDINLWASYILANRGYIDKSSYPKLQSFVASVDSYDVVIGLIADDEMMKAFTAFAVGSMTIEGLNYCLTKVNLGRQYVFKNDSACRHIQYLNIEQLSQQRNDELKMYGDRFKSQKEGVIKEAKRMFRYGTLFEDFLERWE